MTRKDYRKMLETILKSSGWSQEYLANRLGVSFPTVNFWLNGKSVPREKMQERIRKLYLAQEIPYDGPEYITLLDVLDKVKIGDRVLLSKTLEDGLDGYEVYALNLAELDSKSQESPGMIVGNASSDVALGTSPGSRIYDRVSAGTVARVMFIINNKAIAVIEDWGIEG